MNHYRLTFCICYFLLFISVISKVQSISGVVTSCAAKQPLAGVTVKIAGKSLGTATDNEGNILNGIKSEIYMFEFSFVGIKNH
ncbi:MAG: carboxypeptidase-like regulatory domain-containing protein [Dysgonamonadaceae bacterium]|nr:carboxypeptidase-like regulatory domain-containing protein [Dysgonamonadaceae bacterium]